MSKPGRKRPPKGDGKGGSLTQKDNRATSAQRQARADLIDRFRAKTGPAEADQSA